MAIDAGLILEAGDLNYDEVYKAGDQVIAKYNYDFSSATGNNFMDAIKMPGTVNLVQILIDVVAAASATPQLWCKFHQRFARNVVPSDPHILLATHEDTSLASRYDLNAAELTTNQTTQLTAFPYYFTSGRSSGAEPHIWNKIGCALQFVSVDVGDTGEMDFTLVITNLDQFYGLR